MCKRFSNEKELVQTTAKVKFTHRQILCELNGYNYEVVLHCLCILAALKACCIYICLRTGSSTCIFYS